MFLCYTIFNITHITKFKMKLIYILLYFYYFDMIQYTIIFYKKNCSIMLVFYISYFSFFFIFVSSLLLDFIIKFDLFSNFSEAYPTVLSPGLTQTLNSTLTPLQIHQPLAGNLVSSFFFVLDFCDELQPSTTRESLLPR